MHNPIIFARDAANISIVAAPGGTLDGQGAAWWACAGLKPGPGNLSAAPCSGYRFAKRTARAHPCARVCTSESGA